MFLVLVGVALYFQLDVLSFSSVIAYLVSFIFYFLFIQYSIHVAIKAYEKGDPLKLLFFAKKFLFLLEWTLDISIILILSWSILFAMHFLSMTLIVNILTLLIFLLSSLILVFSCVLVFCYSHIHSFIKKFFHIKPTPNALARFFYMTASISHRDFPLSVKLAKKANQYLSDALSQKYGFLLKVGEMFEKRIFLMNEDARKSVLNELAEACSDERNALKVLANIVDKNEYEIIERKSWRGIFKVLEYLLKAVSSLLSIIVIILRSVGLPI